MCIPIELDVPVVTIDRQEIGIAREILCPCPGEVIGATAVPNSLGSTYSANDLWLRVTRAARSDLYIPFGEIAETLADGVRLRITASDLAGQLWDQMPAAMPIPA